jgi:hypothetical protein
MAVDGFRPEIWSAKILVALRNKLVYAGLCNTDYEGDISDAGDTVHITSIGEVATRAYTEHTSISWDEVSDSQQDLLIDQLRYFAIKVDDVERKQALPFLDEATRSAAYGLADNADAVVSAAMYAAVNGTGNDLGDVTIDISDNNAYPTLVSLRNVLTRDNVPDDGRWVVVSPEFYGALLQDNRFIDASASGSTEALRSGFVGRAAGFDVFESNQTPDPTANRYAIIAGHRMATSYADQIVKTEAIRLEDYFADGVRGLHVFGREVVRPECLAMATCVVQA